MIRSAITLLVVLLLIQNPAAGTEPLRTLSDLKKAAHDHERKVASLKPRFGAQPTHEFAEAECALAKARARLALAQGKKDLGITELRKVARHHENELNRVLALMKSGKWCGSLSEIDFAKRPLAEIRAELAHAMRKPDSEIQELHQLVLLQFKYIAYMEELFHKAVVNAAEVRKAQADLVSFRRRLGAVRGGHVTLASGEVQRSWQQLGAKDALAAFEAAFRLERAPAQSLPWIQEHLRPLPRPEPERTTRLIAELDNDSYEARERAYTDLTKMGDAVNITLREGLKHPSSLEQKLRLERLLEKLADNAPAMLRARRAVEVLENMGTLDAKKLLQAVSAGAPDARVTRDAAAALVRLEKQRATGLD